MPMKKRPIVTAADGAVRIPAIPLQETLKYDTMVQCTMQTIENTDAAAVESQTFAKTTICGTLGDDSLVGPFLRLGSMLAGDVATRHTIKRTIGSTFVDEAVRDQEVWTCLFVCHSEICAIPITLFVFTFVLDFVPNLTPQDLRRADRWRFGPFEAHRGSSNQKVVLKDM